MIITETTVKPVPPPPRTFRLELDEQELTLIYNLFGAVSDSAGGMEMWPKYREVGAALYGTVVALPAASVFNTITRR